MNEVLLIKADMIVFQSNFPEGLDLQMGFQKDGVVYVVRLSESEVDEMYKSYKDLIRPYKGKTHRIIKFENGIGTEHIIAFPK